MNPTTDWTSVLAVLAAGLILGALIFFISRRRKAPATPKPRTAMAGFVWGVVCTLVAGGVVYYASTFTRGRTNVDEPIVQAKNAFARSEKKEPVVDAAALPPDHPPLPGMAPSTPPVQGTAQPIHLTMSLDPKITDKGGVIYVIARGVEKGHPVAVRRIDTNAFPVTIDFGADDSMMGGALPPKVRLEARLDSDGDAGTSDPGDPHAAADGVAAGATVELTLKK